MNLAELKYIYSTMNNGKSLKLLTKNHQYLRQNKKTMLFTSANDTRNGLILPTDTKGIITTRIGLEAEAFLIERVDFFELVKREVPDIVLVDETELMKKKIIEDLSRIVDELSVSVTCYGILTDFQMKFFEGSETLLRLADVKEELETECHFCNRNAIVNMRLINGIPVFGGEQFQIGDSYLAVCRACFMSEKAKALEAMQNRRQFKKIEV